MPAKRARPPEFPKSVEDVFFSDAREKLVGARPNAQQAVAKTASAARPAQAISAVEDQPVGSWSKLIAAEDVEDEIKAQQLNLAAAVKNATKFKAGEYQQARDQLSVLAAMLAITAEFDGRIRWKDNAAALRDLIGRASMNCKVASDASFNEARMRADDLQLLIRGGSLQLPEPSDSIQWSRVADRSALMRRLEVAEQQGIRPLVGTSRQFEESAGRLLHEAQVVAALSEIIARDDYEFSDDETFVDYAQQMKRQAVSLRNATQSGNYQQAREAAAEIGQSCTRCHEGYRS